MLVVARAEKEEHAIEFERGQMCGCMRMRKAEAYAYDECRDFEAHCIFRPIPTAAQDGKPTERQPKRPKSSSPLDVGCHGTPSCP
ncbi:hypothetical protein L484_017590 [Morus notabilis]|uniref:Uncharacterized protein n=1 Tax=Morus notabilis TaxID=981085 RepID=W9R051_9ROSA|nr:hypothetical protein L484_017590 [Morus notabilis]